MNTIAVGPFESAELWETGGATVAINRRLGGRHDVQDEMRGEEDNRGL